MHRQRLLTQLGQYRSQHPSEREVARRVEQLVQSCEDCFWRTCRPGHVTGAAWILSADRRRCVLVHHRKLGRWLQPGGHADGEGDLAAVALREAQEETGLTSLRLLGQTPFDLDVHEIAELRDPSGALIEDAHEHHDIRYLFVAAGEETPQTSDESHDVRWCTREEALELTREESVLRMMRKAGPSLVLRPESCP